MIATLTTLILTAIFARAISKATGDRARWIFDPASGAK